ncbi:MAG: GTPase HflX, partial [Alphaproteobacteria bacterium]|nr:GTPase HflX [Alphaproteobacteria bacterium]
MREKIYNQRPEPTKTYVLYPQIREHINKGVDPRARLEEACGLALAVHINLVDSKWVKLREIRPATFIGGGLIEELEPVFEEKGIELVIIDANLSPIQQRNLEEKWHIKVIDRTGLILEIFGERASTAEGRLQVELAALQYQKSRLVRSWTHLERQRGGTSATGGPGESQLEIDKRLISERITRIEKDLEKVKQRRALHRKSRQKVPYPIVALVGYTNAGKSTLFNSLTKANVMAEDMLFATLDPTMRLYKLPSGREIILSDTVGFIWWPHLFGRLRI